MNVLSGRLGRLLETKATSGNEVEVPRRRRRRRRRGLRSPSGGHVGGGSLGDVLAVERSEAGPTYQVRNEAIVVPGSNDAVLALTGTAESAPESTAATDAAPE